MKITLAQIDAAADTLIGALEDGNGTWDRRRIARAALIAAFPDADCAALPPMPTMTVAGLPSIGWLARIR